jgi:protease-4
MSDFNDDFPTGVTPPQAYSYGTPPAPPQPGMPPQPGGYAPQPPKKSNKTLWIVLGIFGVLLLCGLGGCVAFLGLAAIGSNSTSSSIANKYGVASNIVTSQTDEATAKGIVDALNTAAESKDTVAFDAHWDRTAIAEYLLPKLLKKVETGSSWDTLVSKAGSVSAARAAVAKVLTAAEVEKELGRPALDQGAKLGTYRSVAQGADGTVITLDTTSGGTMTLNVDSDGVVVGFDSSEFMDGFIKGFDQGVLGTTSS